SEDRDLDLKGLRAVIDSLEGTFSADTRRAQQAGAHLADGSATVVTWASRLCGMSSTSTADRLCVGKQLESLPKLAEALREGAVSYQSASLLCHLRDQLGAKAVLFDEEEMLEHARNFSVGRLRYLCRTARHVADPDGFFNDAEADFSNRRLDISQMQDGMFCVDAILDPVNGAAFKTALDSLAKRLGPDDERSHKQRMADSLGELVLHAMDEGRLPRRNGVRPHLNLTTSLEGIKNELGVPPADLELSLPISTRTLERIACDATVSRVLLADSSVIDVGRATRVVSAPTRRALRARDHGCRFPGCDRNVDWSQPHHIVAWARRGLTKLSNLVLLCYFHHRLVHEGAWQVVQVGREFRFVPPDHVVFRRARVRGLRWAA
ncbi:MAG TPA: DUF222 domain-containing protein, partial [Candidatus Dormibacteraeota bacterium]|nr:DUF222 domain-containing protein [Candidatus Dormibacteraeota bacterium]